MKRFNWNTEKNKQLLKDRGISFEDIEYYISTGHLLDVIANPNKEKYKNQKMFVVEINAYVYLVPFVEDEKEVFFKTLFPSRKATKKYLNREGS